MEMEKTMVYAEVQTSRSFKLLLKVQIRGKDRQTTAFYGNVSGKKNNSRFSDQLN